MPVGSLSTALGSPPNHWKKNEIAQIRKIHYAFRTTLVEQHSDIGDTFTEERMVSLQKSESLSGVFDDTVPETKSLEKNRSLEEGAEAGIPEGSVLRSLNGECKEPAHVPFSDHNAFVEQCKFEFWKDNFRHQFQDRFLSETAESIVAGMCQAQSNGDLRVRHGSMPLGRYLRRKREHITPLALVLHELKTWCVIQLRVMNVYDEASYKEIEARIKYLEMVNNKDIWGPSYGHFRSGLRPLAHDKLFRLFLGFKESLVRARDYSYRCFCKRSSREKFGLLVNQLKDVFFNEMRLLSGLFIFDEKLSDPGCRALQPTDLLNSWSNQSLVNYQTNPVNVLLSELCTLPLVRGALLSNYEEDEDVRASLLDLPRWKEYNLFRNMEFTVVYELAAAKITNALEKQDPHHKAPQSTKKHLKGLRQAFEEESDVVVEQLLNCLASLQDLIPIVYMNYQLWEVSGMGGDFTLYDTLRAHCIQAMQLTLEKLFEIEQGQTKLLKLLKNLASQNEKKLEAKRIKTRKAEYKPAWIQNFHSITHDQFQVFKKSMSKTYKLIWGISKDAWEYDLDADQMTTKVDQIKTLISGLAERVPQLPNYTGDFKPVEVFDPNRLLIPTSY